MSSFFDIRNGALNKCGVATFFDNEFRLSHIVPGIARSNLILIKNEDDILPLELVKDENIFFYNNLELGQKKVLGKKVCGDSETDYNKSEYKEFILIFDKFKKIHAMMKQNV